jgi:hypothetical protein
LENIYPNYDYCPNVVTTYEAAVESTVAKTFFANNAPLIQAVSAAVGQKYTSDDQSPLALYDCTLEHLCYGQPLPSGYTDALAQQVVTMAGNLYQVIQSYNNSAFAKTSMAPLISDTLKAMTKMVGGQATQPFRLYSGHDTGPIIPFLAAFGVYDGNWPTYAAMITLELHQSTSNADAWFVRMTYGGAVLNIPGCADSQGLCAWEQFVTIANDIMSYGGGCAAPRPSGHFDRPGVPRK